jgi:hypothetical protein
VSVPEPIELTTRRSRVVQGKQWYSVAVNGSNLTHAGWTPLTAASLRIEIGSWNGATVFTLSRSKSGLGGTYREVGDVASSYLQELPVNLRRVACASK